MTLRRFLAGFLGAAVMSVGAVSVARAITTLAPAAGGAASETSAPAAEAPSSAVTVEKIVIGTGVEAREPLGEAAEFMSSVGRVYCWNKVKSETVPVSIKHVWYADGKMINDVTLNINVSPSRTWSYKTVWPAAWKVEVVDDAGTVIETSEFVVK